MTDKTPKRRIKRFNFQDLMKSGNKAHVALVDGAANEQEVLVMKAKKTDGGETLSASDYAYVPDPDKPSTWKLRIDDASHVSAAVAALGKGFRGNKVEIPEGDMAKVKRKVKAAYKKHYPDKTDDDMPDILKAASVTVSMEMDTFLQRFFGLWEEDADALATILGYSESEEDESEGSNHQHYNQETGHTHWLGGDIGYGNIDDYISKRIGEVSILKGKEIPEELSEDLVEVIKSLQSNYSEKLISPSREGEDVNKSLEGENTMDEKEIQKMQEELVELRKAKEQKAALEAELVELRKAKEEKRKSEMSELVKGLNFVATDTQEDVVKALLNAKDADAVTLVVALEKAREAIAAAVTAEYGHDEEGDVETDTEKSTNYVTQLLKERKAQNNA